MSECACSVARSRREDALVAHRWFAKYFGEQMNGRDFAVKCPVADFEMDRIHADREGWRKNAEDLRAELLAVTIERDRWKAVAEAEPQKSRIELRDRCERLELEAIYAAESRVQLERKFRDEKAAKEMWMRIVKGLVADLEARTEGKA